MKKCIWCLKTKMEVPFRKEAHTIPQKLGGKMICENVCDSCNEYFGNAQTGLPSIDLVLKETFNISRALFLNSTNDVGENKVLKKPTSIYFDIDLKKMEVNLNSKFKFTPSFQEKLSRQLKKGLYKIYLEEIERQLGDGHSEKYNFIREFSRNDIGDLPVFYFKRKVGAFIMQTKIIKHPIFIIKKEEKNKYLIDINNFFEFELFGHTFGIATSKDWILDAENYLKVSMESKKQFYTNCILLNYFNEIDLTLSVLK